MGIEKYFYDIKFLAKGNVVTESIDKANAPIDSKDIAFTTIDETLDVIRTTLLAIAVDDADCIRLNSMRITVEVETSE